MWKKKKNKISLVLAGGGAKGIAHAGVLKFFEEKGYKPDMIVGTSMGAIIGGIWATGKSIDDLKEFYKEQFTLKNYINLRIVSMFDFSLSKFLMGPEAFFRMGNSLGIDKPGRLLELFGELTDDKNIEDLDVEFYCNTVDLKSSKEYIFEKGNLAEAIRASMSVPGVFIPVEKDGMMLVDGGVMDNMPVKIAKDHDADTIIAVDVMDNHTGEFKNAFDVISRVMWVNSIRMLHENKKYVDLFMDASGAAGFGDFDKFEKVFEHGYNVAKKNEKKLDKIFGNGK
ncbi:MAG: patatin-like phospholipase family protein [Kiritimatiellae bacterium]|jgi:NTE family protein|nr:patatin-like phospholipase family protein [Kiritimatiellia bacterium]